MLRRQRSSTGWFFIGVLIFLMLMGFLALFPAFGDIPTVIFTHPNQQETFYYTINPGNDPEFEGNISGYFEFTTNGAGVSVANPITLFFLVQFAPAHSNETFSPSLLMYSGLEYPVQTQNGVNRWIDLNLTGENGVAIETFTGSEQVIFYQTGYLGGIVDFQIAGYGTFGLVTGNVVQVQPEETTFSFASGVLLLSLEFLIAALIVLEIAESPIGYRNKSESAQPNYYPFQPQNESQPQGSEENRNSETPENETGNNHDVVAQPKEEPPDSPSETNSSDTPDKT